MRVIMEVETEADLTMIAKLIQSLTLSVKRIRTMENQKGIKEFLQFIDREAIPVETVVIPSREDRNAR